MKIDKTLKITIGIILIALTTTAFIIDLKFGGITICALAIFAIIIFANKKTKSVD